MFDLCRVERIDQIDGVIAQISTLIDRYEIPKNKYTRVTKIVHHFGCKSAAFWRLVCRYFAHCMLVPLRPPVDRVQVAAASRLGNFIEPETTAYQGAKKGCRLAIRKLYFHC